MIHQIAITLLEIIVIISVLLIIGGIIRRLICEPRGTRISPFDTSKAQEIYSGKAIADSITSELVRIYRILESKWKEERQNEDDLNIHYSKYISVRTVTAEMEVKSKTTDYRPSSRIIIKESIFKSAKKVETTSGIDASRKIEDVTVNMAGTTFSLGQLLMSISQLWTDNDPEFAISGSLQKFGSQTRLVANIKSRNKDIEDETFEVTRNVENGDELIPAIKDLAYQIANKIGKNDFIQKVNHWEGLKYYTEALDDYQHFNYYNNKPVLERACNNALQAAKTEPGYFPVFDLLYNLTYSSCTLAEPDFKNGEKLCRYIMEQRDIGLEPAFHARVNRFYADLKLQQGFFIDSEAYYRRALKYKDDNVDAYYNLSLVLFKLGYTENRLEEVVDAATKKFKSNELSQLNLGNWYYEIGVFDKAEQSFRKVLSDDPKNAYLLFMLGRIYIKLDRPLEEIKGFFSEAISIAENSNIDPVNIALIYNEFGSIYNDNNDLDNAVACYSKAIEYNPINAALYNNLGISYYYRNQMNEAHDKYIYAISLDPNFADPYNNLGLIFASENNIDRAIEEYTNAIEYDSNFLQPHNNLGNIYEGIEKYDDALKEYEAAIKIDPSFIASYIFLADIYHRRQKNLKKAIELLSICMDKGIADANTFAYRGDLYDEAGMKDESMADYKIAVEQDPENSLYHSLLAYMYMGEKLFNEAILELNESIRLNPGTRWSHAALAVCYKKLGNESSYKSLIQEALQLPPQADEDDYSNASFEALCGRNDEALHFLKIALDNQLRSPEFASQDTDFEFIRDDPRFRELVGL